MNTLPARSTETVSTPAEFKLFRAFFAIAIVSILTTGCMLGALAMLGISVRRSFTSPEWSPFIMAHANSQLYGWVGLFIMGFALYQHPPRESRQELYRLLAIASLALIAASIPIRFAAEALVSTGRMQWATAGTFSGIMQAIAVLIFVANIGLTRQRTLDPTTGGRKGIPWQSRFVFASLGWWAIVAVAEPIVFAATHQSNAAANVRFIGEWFVPLRDAQFLGFVINMIFGVALARLSSDFDFAPGHRTIGSIAFALWNVGIVVRMFGWLKLFHSGMHAGEGWYYTGGVLLAWGAIAAALSARLYERPSTRMPTHKFLRAAFGWLLATGILLIFEPIHLAHTGAPFSHAYTGAIRHGLTVGFISQMIIGVSLGTIPRLMGRNAGSPIAYWAIFLLLNVGNGMRVIGQIVTDYTPAAFHLLGCTGFIEVTGIITWAVVLMRIMFARPSQQPDAIAAPPAHPRFLAHS